jgi:hypothetical protein
LTTGPVTCRSQWDEIPSKSIESHWKTMQIARNQK